MQVIKLAITVISVLFASQAFALGGESPLSNSFQYLYDIAFGTFGEIVSILAIAIVGLGCKYHRFQLTTLFTVIAGVAIYWGAPVIFRVLKMAAGGF